jgi:hypothetical protein
MAQELSDPMAANEQQSEISQGSSDFPTVSGTPDQSEIPHHGAVDPTSSSASEQSASDQQS